MTEDAQISTAPLQTDQQGPHPDLASVVRKHLQTTWCKPVPEHTKRAFDTALTWLARQGNPPVVLDSFCGTGMSTASIGMSLQAGIGIVLLAIILDRISQAWTKTQREAMGLS